MPRPLKDFFFFTLWGQILSQQNSYRNKNCYIALSVVNGLNVSFWYYVFVKVFFLIILCYYADVQATRLTTRKQKNTKYTITIPQEIDDTARVYSNYQFKFNFFVNWNRNFPSFLHSTMQLIDHDFLSLLIVNIISRSLL